MLSDTGQMIYCPRCKARDIRQSHQRKAWDSVMQLLLAAPLRCRGCGKRFYKRLNAPQRPSSVNS